MVEKALSLVRKETDRWFFFSRLKNPLWIQPLDEKKCFQSPPKARRLPDNSVLFPFWPEFQYLKNVCVDAPEKVIELVLKLPKMENPTVCDDILDIALQLSGEQSARLKSKILECAEVKIKFSGHKYSDLLIRWTAENQISTVLELSKILVRFEPDPQAEEKRESRKNRVRSIEISLSSLLTPSPRFDDWEYREIMDKGVRPLAEKEPWTVARILIDATASMIRMTMHPEDIDETEGAKRYEILSYRALDRVDYTYTDSKWCLVQAMKFSCEKVFKKSPESIALLNESLCNQRWKVFRHLREHLYTLYLNEQTKPWIRELILTHKNYDWNYSYHFQKMIRIACEHFGAGLLSEKELERIFETICNGPSQESSRKRMGERFTEEEFKKDQRRSHRLLLRPFAFVLFGKYLSYFQELEDEFEEKKISDKDYLRFRSRSYGGKVKQRSPKPQEELAKMADEDLLVYINEWNDNHYDEKEPLVDINIEALAREFGNVFKKFIMPNPERLEFWMKNREQIQRPIYVRHIVEAMHEQVKTKNFDNLDKWLSFCKWVLSYYDQSVERVAKDGQKYKRSDELEKDMEYNPRWAVGDFIETCFKEEVDAPISHRKSLARLLEMLCTQFDWGLDQGKLLRSDLMDEAINNIRSRGLKTLVKFGFWVRRHDEEAKVSEVTSILENRFDLAIERPLTLPEYAVLGAEYPRIYFLDQTWTEEHKLNFFPKDRRKEWLAAFGSFLRWHQPYLPIFEFLREEFVFALGNLKDMEKDNSAGENLIDVIGQKLFTYYLWGVYPLSGRESLIARYYQETKTTKEQWKSLFTWVGFVLQNHDGNMEEKLLDRFKEFFEWRLNAREMVELGEFFLWMEAECLEAEWRLDAYSRVLDFIDSVDAKSFNDWGRFFNRLVGLRGMLEKHTAKVVECFAKMTDIAFKNNSTYFYIPSDDAKAILKAGLGSKDEIVIEKAKQAQKNLLKIGRFEFLNLDE